MPFQEILNFATKIAIEAGNILLESFGKIGREIPIEYKSEYNLVTAIDRKSEKFIIDAIQKEFPTHNILAEESSETEQDITTENEFKWIIDPLDGTTNYSHAHPFFAVSIGLAKKNDIVLGVVNVPYLKEIFSAVKGHGSYLNGKKIHVSNIPSLHEALLSTGFLPSERKNNVKHFEYFLHRTQEIRRGGAAAIDLCYIAAGKLDGYWEKGLKPWDIAAGKLIIEEAGGLVTDLDGSPCNIYQGSILATNKLLHSQMTDYFSSIKS